jgi:pyridoxamine 5'-phosphate oxidase|tara:strand:- start:154 stop:750 length:597 start_codon:yes stop_codon:yes gene_type:complete
MIKFNKLNQETPYLKFKEKYDEAMNANQKNIEALCISSYSHDLNEVNSRFVNLKFIDDKDFIFFSNYNSPKSEEFRSHDQVTVVIFWNNINIQIRIKALIKKTTLEFNNSYFVNRSEEKNALAISSDQSKYIDSYESVINGYKESLEFGNLKECPDFWGGYSFTPYYFEFWEGHSSRLNKRDAFKKDGNFWHHSILQP